MAFLGDVFTPIVSRSGGLAQRAPARGNEYTVASYSGGGNNLSWPAWGSNNAPLRRHAAAAYDGDVARPAGPNARMVSNAVCQGTSVPDPDGRNNLVWVWGQFIDHTIGLTPNQTAASQAPDAPETLVTPVPTVGEDPTEVHAFPGRTITLTRSQFETLNGVRQQTTSLGSYLDAANVYGATEDRALALRQLDGTGQLKTGMAANGEVILPMNVRPDGMAQLHMDALATQAQTDMFMAGDARANENIGLTAMHALWVREHNRLCGVIAAQHPEWASQDEMLYQHARRLVRGAMQAITFYEWLPLLIGPLPDYAGYHSGIDATLANEFSAAAFRFGHSMLPETLTVNSQGDTLALSSAFFVPTWTMANGADGVLAGLAATPMQAIDTVLVESVRSMLFGPPTATAMLDLAVLNIMRGRDHGLPGYSAMRAAYGLTAIPNWDAMPAPADTRAKLATLYSSPAELDPWVGCLAETRLPGKAVGPLMYRVLLDQFRRMRDGDRFWFENDPALSAGEKGQLKATRLGAVISRNCAGAFAQGAFGQEVFRVPQ